MAKVVHSFGRADQGDKVALARLVSSISRFLTPEEAAAAATGIDVEVVDSRRLGGAWTLPGLGRAQHRCGGAAVRRCGGAAVRRCGGAAVRRCDMPPKAGGWDCCRAG